jgi:DNA-binding NtrC family response regulator
MEKLRVLHVDDNIYDLQHVKKALESTPLENEFFVESVSDVQGFLAALQAQKPDIILLDIHLDKKTGGEGIELAKVASEKSPESIVIMRSTADDAKTIANCLRGGADDFISKKSDNGELSLRLSHAYRLGALKSGQGHSQFPKSKLPKFSGNTLKTIANMIPGILDSAITTVHTFGETGCGKEVVSELFEAHVGPSVPFVKVNCGAIAPTLMESELFGHIKGAFTGANSDKVGLFERADGGWIFLDEVATLSGPMQIALLRVIENQEIKRVGDTRPRKINVRVISATNEDLKTMVSQNKFRGDLLQRLSERLIFLPPLRDRKDEIPGIVEHFAQTMTGGPYKVVPSVMEVFMALDWSAGNIRQLRNTMKAMTEYSADQSLTPLAIPEQIWQELDGTEKEDSQNTGSIEKNGSQESVTLSWSDKDEMSFEFLTDQLLVALMERARDQLPKLSMRKLATAVGMPRSTLSERLKRLVHRDMIERSDWAHLLKGP